MYKNILNLQFTWFYVLPPQKLSHKTANHIYPSKLLPTPFGWSHHASWTHFNMHSKAHFGPELHPTLWTLQFLANAMFPPQVHFEIPGSTERFFTIVTHDYITCPLWEFTGFQDVLCIQSLLTSLPKWWAVLTFKGYQVAGEKLRQKGLTDLFSLSLGHTRLTKSRSMGRVNTARSLPAWKTWKLWFFFFFFPFK